jgi:SAM-dependent methyltransferase
MATEGDSELARKRFLENRPPNLEFLLKNRYSWMNKFIESSDNGIEVGCGSGLSKLFVENENLLLTDYDQKPWVDLEVDAMNMPFESGSQDYIIACQVLHHLAKPMSFFEEVERCLRPGGKLLIHDVYASLFLRSLLRLMRHEGYSFDVDPFNPDSICNDPRDPWSANTAISRLLFEDIAEFELNSPLKVSHRRSVECLSLPLSGGVYATARVPTFPSAVLNIIGKFDSILAGFMPNTFATGIELVLHKR